MRRSPFLLFALGIFCGTRSKWQEDFSLTDDIYFEIRFTEP